jgi:hypothetical protein
MQTAARVAKRFNILVVAPLVVESNGIRQDEHPFSESKESRGSVASNHGRAELPNGEHNANNSRHIAIQ